MKLKVADLVSALAEAKLELAEIQDLIIEKIELSQNFARRLSRRAPWFVIMTLTTRQIQRETHLGRHSV